MGMFDNIKVEFELPILWNNDWQTKDLDCSLDYYLITKDKKLIRTSFEDGDDDIKNNGLLGPIDFTGEIKFYDSIMDKEFEDVVAKISNPLKPLSKLDEYIINNLNKLERYIHIEYSAYFLQGELKLLTLIHPWYEPIKI